MKMERDCYCSSETKRVKKNTKPAIGAKSAISCITNIKADLRRCSILLRDLVLVVLLVPVDLPLPLLPLRSQYKCHTWRIGSVGLVVFELHPCRQECS